MIYPTPQAPETGDKSTRVLVVDDDPTARLLSRKSLSNAGFAVETAGDGNEALEKFDELRPELVMLDVEMPELDGYETCVLLRERPHGATVPIMMVTSRDDVASIDEAYQAGATDFVPKPINWTILQHRIRYMLRNSTLMTELADSKASLDSAQRIAHLGNWVWDLTSDALTWSDGLYRILGSEPKSIPAGLGTILSMTDETDHERIKTAIMDALKKRQARSTSYQLKRADGASRVMLQQTEPVLDAHGRVARLQGTLQDITERREAEEKIRYLAYYDSLTDLPNRQLFRERVQTALELTKRHGRQLAVLFFDLDNFKRINDTLGHNIGDLLLKAVAERLRGTLRSSDGVTRDNAPAADPQIGRFGGDEFLVLLSQISQGEDAARVARRLLKSLSQPVNLSGYNVYVTSSIGIAIYPGDGEDAATLLKSADTAMYHAKRAGKNVYQFYDEGMNDAALKRLSVENELQKALENREFKLVYQPQVDLMAGSILGVEALLRWENPLLGVVSPMDFVPLAEETGLIISIGEWVLRTASLQAKAWQDEGLPPLRVAVNLSARQFMHPDLLKQVAAVLEETGLDAQYLELEITESLLMEDVEQAIKTMDALKAMGVWLAIDDFGTGYSSLSYLKRFPIDRLKIDRSFVRDINEDPDSAAIALAIVSMAHNLNLGVVAEGVETEAQQLFLKKKLCDEAQGYLYSCPLPADELGKLLDQQRSADTQPKDARGIIESPLLVNG